MAEPEPYCEHCDLPVAMCPHGRPVPSWQALAEAFAEAQERTDGLGPWISSRYDGRCAGCGGRWSSGDLIRYGEEEGGWLGECCGGGLG